MAVTHQSFGTSITVTVGAALTGATIPAVVMTVAGLPAGSPSTLTEVHHPMQLHYTYDGGANTVVSGYVNGNHINLGTPAVGSHTVHVVSIQDACMSFVPSLPGDYTIQYQCYTVSSINSKQHTFDL